MSCQDKEGVDDDADTHAYCVDEVAAEEREEDVGDGVEGVEEVEVEFEGGGLGGRVIVEEKVFLDLGVEGGRGVCFYYVEMCVCVLYVCDMCVI